VRVHRYQRAVQEPAWWDNANVARKVVIMATPVLVSMRMFSLFFGSNVMSLIVYFLLSNSKLLQTHAKARRPLPHAKKTSLSLQNALVVVLGPDPLKPALVKLVLPQVTTKVNHNGQRARDPMSLKPQAKNVNVPTKIFVSLARNAPRRVISKAFVSVLQVMMLFAWKKSHLPTNVQ